MAYLHARSNVCRSGVTHAGLVYHPMTLTVGGTSRKGETLQKVKFTVRLPLDGSASTCTLRLSGTRPAVGQDLLIGYGGEIWWGGTVVETSAHIIGQLVHWDVLAQDWRWLLDRYAVVNEVFYTAGINTVARRILASATNGGFTVGYMPASLGDVDTFVCDTERVLSALQRLAKLANGGAGAYLRIKPDKSVDIAGSFPDGLALTWTNSSDYRDPVWQEVLHQVRTRTFALGRSTRLTAQVNAGATTIPVEDVTPFVGVSGSAQAVCELDDLTYTGVSATSGAGELTGVAGVAEAHAAGAAIRVRAQVDDAAAQAALATVLGAGRSGIVTNVLQDDAWTLAEVAARAAADVALNQAPAQAVAYTVLAPSAKVRAHAPGAVLSASVTAPLTITGDFIIQAVEIQPFDSQASETDPWLRARVSAGPVSRQSLVDRLQAR